MENVNITFNNATGQSRGWMYWDETLQKLIIKVT